jgi:hypothetical protein
VIVVSSVTGNAALGKSVLSKHIVLFAVK